MVGAAGVPLKPQLAPLIVVITGLVATRGVRMFAGKVSLNVTSVLAAPVLLVKVTTILNVAPPICALGEENALVAMRFVAVVTTSVSVPPAPAVGVSVLVTPLVVLA